MRIKDIKEPGYYWIKDTEPHIIQVTFSTDSIGTRKLVSFMAWEGDESLADYIKRKGETECKPAIYPFAQS